MTTKQRRSRVKPRPKVAAAGGGAVVATLLVGIAAQFGVTLDPTLAAALAGAFAFLAGWAKTEAGV